MPTLTRRSFVATAALTVASLGLPRGAWAATHKPLLLTATSRTLDVDGRAATVWGLVNAQGGSGLTLDPGQRFRVDLTNALDVDTIIHWHGQIPPNSQDGVPDIPLPMLKPGEVREFDYEPMPGTYWMHSHVPVQEMELLAAPLIVRSAADVAADRQEVVMFLHDFSFRPAAEVLAEITGGDGNMAGMEMGAATPAPDAPHDMEMPGMVMDLNDFNFDAYLANDRTLNDPEVVRVDNGGRVRLRIINAAAATVFWIDTGAVEGRLVAVDGHDVQPSPGRRFGLAMGQRLDIELDLPGGEGAFPVLALREGAVERTGIILATAGATIEKLAGMGETAAAAFDTDLSQEAALRAMTPLSDRPADTAAMLMLGGSMQPYQWTINGQTWGNHTPVTARSGQRVELTFHNMSMMAHPMHLHGHAFQVVALNGKRFAGAMRDTVQVPPQAMVTVALDAGEAARWMLHCHHMPHLSTGMMTEFAVSA
ncbi:multicopper oxidase family protein [Cypionkella sp.]|uniref:multicopper oxidase family protein n=1 Tax=Cypionkella sp. TaxID=2811411 RepID=UPI002ABC3498|nr:multicopper oxidase family protein [Cypionkella sp.]MDZ4391524.1 multicopper oxidase family protein [Cypionkella sp.]